MTAWGQTTSRAWVKLACVSCGGMYDISERSERRRRVGQRSSLCPHCSRRRRDLVVSQAMMDWWRQQYTDEEVVELAEQVWGDVSTWDPAWRNGFAFE